MPATPEPLWMIVAYARGRVIGRNGGLPWKHPADLRHFKAVTQGHPIIMGRSTFAGLGKPLPGRRNIVLSRSVRAVPGVEVFADLATAIAAARGGPGTQPPVICGGANVYAQALPLCTRLYLTEIDEDHAGDAVLPPIDEGPFSETERRSSGVLTFRTLQRHGTTD